MTTYPNCKINLGLHVVGKRPDGYHDLETIFLPVDSLRDALEIIEAPLSMQQDGITLDNAPEDNLCMKAWTLLHEELGIPTVSIRLKKGIPFGAGLGGGSADAAFTLKMLNEMFSIGLNDNQLEQFAARLGADCAFFIKNQPAYATGIGAQLEPIEWKVESEKWKVFIEIPEGEHVSTKEAYSGLKRDLFGTARPDLRESIKRPIEEWKSLIVNDFEASVFPSHPVIAALKENMYARGALYASMTGSGAAVFGIFAN
ncbi:MAG: 4-(cytidine 5'-diphospho)-2-C-methyl-D-erythritol kinase [bacterium]